MKILLTNLTLATRSGTEIVIRDLALGLAAAGHTPAVFTPDPGPIAQEIRNAGICVVSDVDEMTDVPDLIHGHHYVETAAAMLRFPRTPAIFVCHDRLSWHDLPPKIDQIRRYVAVDRNCFERLTEEAGISPEKARIVHNAVDIRRFVMRDRLPEQPRRALIFSNYAARGTHLEPIVQACSLLGISVDVVGARVQTSSEAPEHLLPGYDLVFAKGRCALEAIAAGTAVILCDTNGLGSLVKMSDVELLRDWNFGMRCLQQKLTPGAIASEISKYDSADAQAVSSWIRRVSSLDIAIKTYVQLYEEVIAEAQNDTIRTTVAGMLKDIALTCSTLESRLRSAGSRPTVALPYSCIQQISLKAVDQVRTMEAGGMVHILAEIENASNETLASRPPYPVQLAYHWIDPVSQEMVVREGLRTPLNRDVPPRGLHRQPQVVQVPERAGQYLLRLTVVQEFVCWFNEVNPAAVADLFVNIKGTEEPNPDSLRGTLSFELQRAVEWTDGLTLIRNGEFSNAGFVSNTFQGMLTFIESQRFTRELQRSPHITCVITTPEIAPAIAPGIGLAVCENPRTAFVDIHNRLAETTSFYWRDFPTFIHPSARIHPTAQVPPFNVVVGAGSIIQENAVVAEHVIIGERCVLQSGVVIGAEGFQTDRSGNQFREMVHAGCVRLDEGARVFAGAVIARGVFREATHIGREARIGNRAFLSHNVHVGGRAFVGHGAVINGNVQIGERAWIGPGVTIANGVSVGPDAHVSLGSTVIRDVEKNARVSGAVAVKTDRMFRFIAQLEKH